MNKHNALDTGMADNLFHSFPLQVRIRGYIKKPNSNSRCLPIKPVSTALCLLTEKSVQGRNGLRQDGSK